MNSESKISVHYSSLVGLKAELLKKQEEAKIAKAKLESITAGNKIKFNEKAANNKEKKTKNVEPSPETDDIESMKTLKKSKLMLQAKSRLYDKLSKTRTNMNPNFLVDFEHKTDDPHESEEENFDKNNDFSEDDSDSEWVEYTDCFGRTRKCLREDLPKMKEKDKSVRNDVLKNPDEHVQEEIFYVEDRIPEKEAEIEIMRRKWEEQTAKLSNKADIHYQDILFDEARTHGVGYYAFSQDEKEREKQQDELNKLRKETEKKQKESESIREVKQKMQLNRLRVARIRQRIRAGLSAKEAEEEIQLEDAKNQLQSTDNETSKITNEGDTPSAQSKAESDDSKEDNNEQDDKNKFDDIENKIQAFGELLGKRNQWYVMTQEEWVDKKRKERITEFGPGYGNFQHSETFNLSDTREEENTSKQSTSYENNQQSSTVDSSFVEEKEQSSEESDIIGPMPPSTLEINPTKGML